MLAGAWGAGPRPLVPLEASSGSEKNEPQFSHKSRQDTEESFHRSEAKCHSVLMGRDSQLRVSVPGPKEKRPTSVSRLTPVSDEDTLEKNDFTWRSISTSQ